MSRDIEKHAKRVSHIFFSYFFKKVLAFYIDIIYT